MLVGFGNESCKASIAVEHLQVWIPLHVLDICEALIDRFAEIIDGLIGLASNGSAASEVIERACNHLPILSMFGSVGQHGEQLLRFAELLFIGEGDGKLAHAVQSVRVVRTQNAAAAFERFALQSLSFRLLSLSA